MKHEIWIYQVVEIKEHLSPAHKISVPGYFNLEKTHFWGIGVLKTHLQVSAHSSPCGLERKGEREGGDGSKAREVDCEGAVVLLGELAPIHLGNDTGAVLLPPPWCCGGGARKNLLKTEPICLWVMVHWSFLSKLHQTVSMWIGMIVSLLIPSFVFTDL